MNSNQPTPTYTGGMLDGMRHGHGVYDGLDHQYIGLWVHDEPHGKGTRQMVDGLMEHGLFEHGLLAMGRRAWPNGDFEEGRFINGALSAGKRQRGNCFEERAS